MKTCTLRARKIMSSFGHGDDNAQKTLKALYLLFYLFKKVYLLCGIYVACALVAVLITSIFADTHEKIGLKCTKKFNSSYKLFLNTLKHIKDTNQLLIIPLTLWFGVQQVFIGADFTKVFF